MTSRINLAELRHKIGKQESLGTDPWPVVTSGAAALDASLPAGGLVTGTVHEFLPAAHGDFAAMLGFGLGVLSRVLSSCTGHVLWALPSYQQRAWGSLYPSGLASFGIDPDLFTCVKTPKTQNMLWALEEALANEAVAAVIGILPENDSAYDFTASRRLAMRAARHGVTAFIFSSQPQFAMATAAEMRWLVSAHPSRPIHYPGHAMPGTGPPRWQAELVKSRKGNSGCWAVEWNHETLSFRLAAPLADRAPVRVFGHATGQRTAA